MTPKIKLRPSANSASTPPSCSGDVPTLPDLAVPGASSAIESGAWLRTAV